MTSTVTTCHTGAMTKTTTNEDRAIEAMYAHGLTNLQYLNTGGGCMVIQLPHPSIEDGYVWVTEDGYDADETPEWVIGIYDEEDRCEANEYHYVTGDTDALLAALDNLYTGTRDYSVENDRGDDDGLCNDCGTPAYYDRADENYHHAVSPERGCFLIPSEDRADDPLHPHYVAYSTFTEVLTLSRPEYVATVEENATATLYRLVWGDYVANEWTEEYYSLSAALTRLAALDLAVRDTRFFLHGADRFNNEAHTFLNSQLGE